MDTLWARKDSALSQCGTASGTVASTKFRKIEVKHVAREQVCRKHLPGLKLTWVEDENSDQLALVTSSLPDSTECF